MRMTQIEKQTFLKQPHVAVLAVNEPERGPLTVPIWYDYDMKTNCIQIITDRESKKGTLLSKGNQIGLSVQVDQLPYKYVSVQGSIELVAATKQYELTDMAIRYLGEVDGEAYANSMDYAGMVTVTIKADYWLGADQGK